MTVTRALAKHIRAKAVSRADLDCAALLALDAAANIVAGANSEPGRRLIAWARDTGIVDPGGGLVGDPGRVAFLLGALCHILEVDDLHRASVVHPGCAVVPVLWALRGDDAGAPGGREALTALLHGFEATTRLGMAVGPAHYRIWHNTATCGPFGSAAAAAALLGLDEDAVVDAFGNAGTQAGGLWQFLDTGAMSKHVHAGRAAEAGLVAASLARHGLTGAPAILEGPRGFFAAMCPDGDAAAVMAGPGSPWQAHMTSIKPWPSCRHTHPAIDAAQELRRRLADRGLSADDVAGIGIGAYRAGIALCDNPAPASTYAAKFSLQHCVAAALARDDVWFEAFDAPEREALAALRGRASLRHDASLESAYPAAWGAGITLRLRDGSELAAARRHARGDPELALDAAAMRRKAARLLAHGTAADPDRFIDAVLAMAQGAPLPALPVLQGARGGDLTGVKSRPYRNDRVHTEAARNRRHRTPGGKVQAR